jgi:hypothetical protein
MRQSKRKKVGASAASALGLRRTATVAVKTDLQEISVRVCGQLQGRPVFTRPERGVLPQRQLDCFDAVHVAALTQKLAVLGAKLTQDFEYSVVHQTHQLRVAHALALAFEHSLDPARQRLRSLAVLLSENRELLPRAPDGPFQLGKEAGVHGIGTRLEGFDRLLASRDQDREQRPLLVWRPRFDPRRLTQ